MNGGSGAYCAGNLPFGGTLLPRSPNRTNRPPPGSVYLWCISLPHRKRHVTDARFVEYRAACGRRSAVPENRRRPTCFLFVGYGYDFSTEDKASGVKFCTAVHRRPRQGISHFCDVCSPRSPKSDESASAPPPPQRSQ